MDIISAMIKGRVLLRLQKIEKISICLVMSVSVLITTVTWAEEMSPFQVISMDGELKFKLTTDDYTGRASSADVFRKGSSFEQVFDIMVRSYIYHPNLMRLNFGGGPVFNQYKYNSNTYDLSGNDQTFSFHIAANILEKKPYPLALHFNHVYGNSASTTMDRMLLESTRYGFNFSLLKPITPVAMSFSFASVETKGRNSQRITNEDRDNSTFTMSGDIGSNGNGFLGLYRVQSKNKSGSRSLPIATRSRMSDTLNIRTEHWFLEDEKVRVANFFSYRTSKSAFSNDQISFSTDLGWAHSDFHRSYYRYAFRDNTVASINSTAHSLSAGLRSFLYERSLQTKVGVTTDVSNSDDGFKSNNYNANLSLNYLQDLGPFNVRYSSGWVLDYTDREVSVAQVGVWSELHILNNTTPVSLSSDNVIAGSVVVNNQANTQVYVENIDYILTNTGNITQVQRIPTGVITNGETVSINYSYDSGGTTAFSGFSQSYGVHIAKGRYFGVYGDYHQQEWSVESGDPTTPFVANKTLTFGFNIDLPFATNWLWGVRGDIKFLEKIDSSETQSASVYLRVPVRHNANLRLFSDWRNTSSDAFAEDIELIRYGLRLKAQPWYRTSLSADITNETETGRVAGRRSYTSASASFDWAIRQVRLGVNARYNIDTLGVSERERTWIGLHLSRRF